MLLVPPTAAAGSNVNFLLFPFCLWAFWSSYIYNPFYFFVRVPEHCGLGERQSCRFLCFVFSDAYSSRVEYGGRRQEEGGKLGSKLPDRLVNRQNLLIMQICYSYQKLLRLPGGCFVFVRSLFLIAMLLLLLLRFVPLIPWFSVFRSLYVGGYCSWTRFAVSATSPRHQTEFFSYFSSPIRFFFLSFGELLYNVYV